MENIETNKQVIRDFFAAVNAKDTAKTGELFSDDLDWWIIGKAKVSGHKDKRAMQLGFKLIFRAFEGFHFILHDFTAEENRVAVTAESKAKHSSGKDYNNHYHFLFTLQNGKIWRVKEYFDTEHAIWIENG